MKSRILLLLPFFFFSCEQKEQAVEPKKQWSNEQSTEMNETLAKTEEIDIKIFLARRENWKVEETGSGLRFVLLKEGNGQAAIPGREAEVHYSISLLDGTVVYETKDDEVDVFLIDKSSVESGIQEGIKKMRVGDKAVLVMPSHLGHGFLGDQQNIPPISPLVVEIELLDVL